jgi:uncharacterized protein YidB (DUF937 family)
MGESDMALMDMVMNLVKGFMGGQGQQAGGDMMSNLVMSVLQNGVQGGAGGLLNQLTQAGLGKQVQSWLSNEPNMPVSAEQLSGAVGNDQLSRMAQQFGVQPDMLSNAMSQFLPGIIDKLGPNGVLQQPPQG